CLLATAVSTIGASTNARIFISDANSHTNGAAINLTSNTSIIGQGVVVADFDTLFGIGTPAQGTLAARPAVNQSNPTITSTIAMNDNSQLRGFNVAVNGNNSGITATGKNGLVINVGTVSTSNNSPNQT